CRRSPTLAPLVLRGCPAHLSPARSPLFPYTTLSRSPSRNTWNWASIDSSPSSRQLRKTPSSVSTATGARFRRSAARAGPASSERSEEHTSELQSRFELVCRLLLEKNETNYQVLAIAL